MEPWKFIRERSGPSAYAGVVTRDYLLPNGVETSRHLHVGRDAVAVVALTTDMRVVLARQFRPGPGKVLDDLPAGGIEDGETPAQAAARELAEETGYVGRVEVIGSTWLAGNATRRRWAAIATACRRAGPPSPDEEEFCEPILLSVADFRDHLRSGQLTDVDIGYLGLDHCDLL